jgi:hypothetical protein
VVARADQTPHGAVFAHHPRNDAASTAKSRGPNSCRQQQRSDAMVLNAIVDGHRELLDALAHRLKHDVPKDPPTGHGDESVATSVIGRRELLGLIVADAA